jgi:hypothetical protein
LSRVDFSVWRFLRDERQQTCKHLAMRSFPFFDDDPADRPHGLRVLAKATAYPGPDELASSFLAFSTPSDPAVGTDIGNYAGRRGQVMNPVPALSAD